MLQKQQKKKPPYVPHGIMGISECVMLEDALMLTSKHYVFLDRSCLYLKSGILRIEAKSS